MLKYLEKNKDTVDILRMVNKIAECIFKEKITISLLKGDYAHSYSLHKHNTEIADVIKYYDSLYVLIPEFKDNTEFIKAVTLALPDVEIQGVPWTP